MESVDVPSHLGRESGQQSGVDGNVVGPDLQINPAYFAVGECDGSVNVDRGIAGAACDLDGPQPVLIDDKRAVEMTHRIRKPVIAG